MEVDRKTVAHVQLELKCNCDGIDTNMLEVLPTGLFKKGKMWMRTGRLHLNITLKPSLVWYKFLLGLFILCSMLTWRLMASL
ncbi:hypothetical protein KC19_4G128800 [Ceratodon purpureus]|uniref:Uncharacterized protein n=1 Tax=Ceratodon purpureus TaxID=3225 RepID=A0A8T0I8G1_CERPU|nr:hypothetical protein KC19_4G128800 [Ceratodon purpureus]